MTTPTNAIIITRPEARAIRIPVGPPGMKGDAGQDGVGGSTGIDWKESVRVATTVNGTLASAFANGQTVDGVVLATNDRILIKNQSTGSQNGIYIVNASGAPTRAADANQDAEVTAGLAVGVSEGTANHDTVWILTTNDPIVVGTTALTFTQLGATSTPTLAEVLVAGGDPEDNEITGPTIIDTVVPAPTDDSEDPFGTSFFFWKAGALIEALVSSAADNDLTLLSALTSVIKTPKNDDVLGSIFGADICAIAQGIKGVSAGTQIGVLAGQRVAAQDITWDVAGGNTTGRVQSMMGTEHFITHAGQNQVGFLIGGAYNIYAQKYLSTNPGSVQAMKGIVVSIYPDATFGTVSEMVGLDIYRGTFAATPITVATAMQVRDNWSHTGSVTGYALHIAAQTGFSIVSEGGNNVFKASVASQVPITVKAAASQTANLFNWTDSSDAALLSVTKSGALLLVEQANPASPAANSGVLYLRDDGGGNTQLCMKFSDGSVEVIAPSGSSAPTLAEVLAEGGDPDGNPITGQLALSNIDIDLPDSPLLDPFGSTISNWGAALVVDAKPTTFDGSFPLPSGLTAGIRLPATTEDGYLAIGADLYLVNLGTKPSGTQWYGILGARHNVQDFLWTGEQAIGAVGTMMGAEYFVTHSGKNTVNSLIGGSYLVYAQKYLTDAPGGVLSSVVGIDAEITLDATFGTVPLVRGLQIFRTIIGSTPITVAEALSVEDNWSSAGTVTGYGLHIGVQTQYGIVVEGGNNVFKASIASHIPVTVKAASGQTANLTNWTNFSDATMLSITKSGALLLAEQTDPSAPASDTGLLYAKDNSGTTVLAFRNSSGVLQLATTADIAALSSVYQPLDSDLTTWAGKTAPTGTAVGTSDTQTLTNKRITKRVTTTNAPGATPTINSDNSDMCIFTGLAAAITSMTTNLSGTPTDGQTLWTAFTDNGTARAITWGASFEASTVALPTTTVISTRLDVGFVWNATSSKWRCVAVA